MKGKDMCTLLFSFYHPSHLTPQMTYKSSPTVRILEWQVHLGCRAGNPGYQGSLKDPLLWAIGQLFLWWGDAVFLEDHFMLLSMFNLHSKALSSKWQTTTEPCERPVNQNPYEICGMSTRPLLVSPRERKPRAFQILIFSAGPLSGASCCAPLAFEYCFHLVSRATYGHQQSQHILYLHQQHCKGKITALVFAQLNSPHPWSLHFWVWR